jgi:hypothetical protein
MENKLDQLINDIPDRFTVNGQTYTVRLEEEVKLDGKMQLGLASLHVINPNILLALKLGKEPVSKGALLNCYYHELFHVMLTAAGLNDNELKVQSLANIFMQYMMTKEYDPDETRNTPNRDEE